MQLPKQNPQLAAPKELCGEIERQICQLKHVYRSGVHAETLLGEASAFCVTARTIAICEKAARKRKKTAPRHRPYSIIDSVPMEYWRLRLGRHVDYFATHVITALRANRVGWDGRAALRAKASLLWLGLMVRATLAAARIGVSSFWNSHRSQVLKKIMVLVRLREVDQRICGDLPARVEDYSPNRFLSTRDSLMLS